MAAQQTAGAPPMRIGIAGLGVASNLVLAEMLQHPHVKITAGADPRPSARDRFASEFGGSAFENVEGLCASPDVDVVYVLTPNRFHAEHAIIAANHGKHVMLDKPMGISLDECDRVVEAVERNGVYMLVGHSQSLDPGILAMAEIANSGKLGRPLMIHTMFFSDWLYRPRSNDELSRANGEGLTMRQGPVQVDIARMLGGGLVRDVRARTSYADPARPIDGGFSAYLEFDGGASATLLYSAYGFYDTTELTYGIDLQGFPADPDLHAKTHQRYAGFASPEEEHALKDSTRYGNPRAPKGRTPGDPAKRHAFFGYTLLSCERGDIRQTPTGLAVYDKDGRREVAVDAGPGFAHRYTTTELDWFYAALRHDQPIPTHTARWGRATTEVCLAIHESSERRETLRMTRQVPYGSATARQAATATSQEAPHS